MISLCLIGKDEAEGFNELMMSCHMFMDEVILVSTANNKELEDKAKFWGAKVYHHKWKNDFADARNYSFSKATQDVIFWADLDDVVINAKNLPELAKNIVDGKVDWISLPYLYEKDEFGRVRARQEKPRLTRRATGEWRKSVHECFEPTKAITHVVSNEVIIDHHQKPDHDTTSANRNLQILLAEYAKDGDKTDARTIFYLGNTYHTLGDYENASKFLVDYLKKTGWDEEKYFAYHILVDCLVAMKQYDLGIDIAFKAIKLFPEWSLAYFDLSRLYSLKGKHDKVIQWTLVGFEKERPKTMNFTNDLDYEVMPAGRLADAYMMTGKYEMALEIAEKLYKTWPKDPLIRELYETCKDVLIKERFVKSFVYVAEMITREDRLKAIQLFDIIPHVLDDDVRIQDMRSKIVPPKNWDKKSIAIYCGRGIGEHWAYPSIFTGIGGSEEAVIQMSIQLNKMGYKVTVYNNCGELNGNYDGVEYVPFYHFNIKDNFDTLISWRTPSLFNFDNIRANKKISWLHDIVYPWMFNEKIIKNTDKFVFLSKWHRNNMPSIPDDKVFISNNGIDPRTFKDKKTKRPNSLLWTSSYDRGLLPFLKNIWPLIKKEISDVTLDIAYGWQNIDREEDVVPELRELKEQLPPLLEQEGIIHHGRLNSEQIAELYKTSQILVYASEFGETNNISSQKAQAAGCYVLTTQQAGATPEYLKFGEAIPFDNIYSDKQVQKIYAEKVVEYIKHPKVAPEGLVEVFSWGETAKNWKANLL